MHISIRSEHKKDQIQTNKPRKENWIIDFLDIETKSDSSWRSMCRKPPHMTKCCFVKSLILTAAAVLQILSGVSWSMWGILAWNPIWYSIMYHVQCMIQVLYHVSVHCMIHVFADNQICWNPHCTMMGSMNVFGSVLESALYNDELINVFGSVRSIWPMSVVGAWEPRIRFDRIDQIARPDHHLLTSCLQSDLR